MTDTIGKPQTPGRLDLPDNVRQLKPANHTRQLNAGFAGSDSVEYKLVLGSDRVDLSSEAMDVWLANQAIKSVPDVRVEKVSTVQRQVNTGIYKVEGDKIAFSMLNESMENNDILNHIDTLA